MSAASRITAPPPRLRATELPRALRERWGLRRTPDPIAGLPRGDGAPVVVLPGLWTNDRWTRVLRRNLAALGYDVRGWGLGINLGTRTVGADGGRLVRMVETMAADAGRPVTLVGWSLGGILARIAAHRAPDAVARVVTIAAPFSGRAGAINVRRAFEWGTGQRMNDRATIGWLREARRPLPMPATAIYSRDDGLVAWQNCLGPETDNVEVAGSHIGMPANRAALAVIADRLARGA